MKNNFNIDAYLRNAEAEFSGADGSEFDYGFDGNADLDFSFDAAPAAPIAPLKQPAPYQISVVNSTAGSLTAILFGKNIYDNTANFGSAVGITCTPASSISYNQLLNQSAAQPFETSLIRIQSTNTAQVTQVININSSDANGQSANIPLYTTSYFSANQFQSGIVDIPYTLKVEGNTYISFTVLANTTVIFDFFPINKVNQSRNLNGQSALQNYATPNVPVAAMPLYVSPRQIGAKRIG